MDMDIENISEVQDDYNGFILISHYLPEEILVQILSYVDPHSLVFRCRIVCKNWKHLIDNYVWKVMVRRADNKSFSQLTYFKRMQLDLPWYVYFSIFKKDPFEKNLLKNNCGQEKLKYWKCTPYTKPLKDGFWNIENPPVGSDPLPNCEDFVNKSCCFVTSYIRAEKEQIVNLRKIGISKMIMDQLQPVITVSEWYAGRYDCGCTYKLNASLLNEHRKTIHEKSEERTIKQWEGRKWEKATITFKNYGPGIRYILFQHEGKDSQYWSGYYGSKMAGSVVKISLPQ